MEFERKRRMTAHLDIAPLVDVVFLLLLFFLLTSEFVKAPGMKIELPKAATARPQDVQDIVVAMSQYGEIMVNGVYAKMDDLPSRFNELFESGSRRIVIIKADRALAVQPVVAVMDIARKAGAEGVTISTVLKREE